jgi:hypothetical protein
VETLLLFLVTSGVFPPLPAARQVEDSVPAASASVAAGLAPAATGAAADSRSASPGPLGPLERPTLQPIRPDFYGAGDAPQRPRAVEYSEAYHVRLAIHHIASFATLPLFVAEYVLGRKLITSSAVSPSTRQAHSTVALGVAGLFAVNTVTGAWNLWDSRRTPQGALRRYLHAGLMFAADAGFVATGLTAPHHRRLEGFQSSASDRNRHQTIAIASMGTALASYAMMLVWRN